MQLVSLRILHTNDFHGTLDSARAARLAELRAEVDLYFDCGDAIRTGNLGIPFRQEPVWDQLADLRCDASVLGNRETHVSRLAFQAKLRGARHPVLCANFRAKSGPPPLPAHVVLDSPIGKVGAFGVMVPMVTERMVSAAASEFLWDDPIETARREVANLKGDVAMVVALTHIGHRQDLELAAACPGIDLILGGHSHTVVEVPVRVGDAWVCQTGSHAKFAGVYEFELGVGLRSARLEPLS